MQMSQHIESHHRRRSITVSDECPTRSIRYLLGNIHVATPAAEVEQLIRDAVNARRALGHAEWTREREDEAVRFALWEHAENYALYAYVMSGRVTDCRCPSKAAP